MRQFAWYSPELDIIILQYIMENFCIAFEWSWEDAYDLRVKYPDLMLSDEIDISQSFLWMPLGEL